MNKPETPEQTERYNAAKAGDSVIRPYVEGEHEPLMGEGCMIAQRREFADPLMAAFAKAMGLEYVVCTRSEHTEGQHVAESDTGGVEHVWPYGEGVDCREAFGITDEQIAKWKAEEEAK
jgi:hypothetical protein